MRPISTDEVTCAAHALRADVAPRTLNVLAHQQPFLSIEGLRAGYGVMEILHNLTLHVARGQSLCLIGPNGAGKSTVLHAIFGFARVFSGSISIGDHGDRRDVTRLSPERKLKEAGIAYILQDKSVFPQMTVEENLLMGGYLLDAAAARRSVESVFSRYERLAARRHHPARVLSGGERRLLEISRALVMDPKVLLVDEPSIGLEPRYIDMVFDILTGLKEKDGKTIVMVEQNARRGLDFADVGYVLVSGELVMASEGRVLAADPRVGELFLGG